MPEDREPVDVYADAFQLTVGPFGVAMTFSLQPSHPDPGGRSVPAPLAVVRMSLEHTKIVAMMLRRHLKEYERQNGLEISLPPGVYTSLGLAREDWGFDA